MNQECLRLVENHAVEDEFVSITQWRHNADGRNRFRPQAEQ